MKIKSKKKWYHREETFEVTDWEPKAKPLLNPSSLKKYKRVALQIDGGGIKGVLPAYQAYCIDYHAKSDLADVVTDYYGTSTGSIIVAALYLGVSAQELLRTYIEEGPSIFKNRNMFQIAFNHSLFAPEYLEMVLHRNLSDMTFKQAKTVHPKKATLNIAVVSKLERKTILCNDKNTPDMKIKDAVRASSAAPMFFPPFRYGDQILLDGGTATYNSLLETVTNDFLFRDHLDPGDFYILSLGTGHSIRPKKPTEKQIKKSMKAFMLKQLMFAVMYGREETVSRQAIQFEKLKKSIKIKGMRWNVALEKDLENMSETDNINELIELVDK